MTPFFDISALRAAYARRSAAYTGSTSNPVELERDRPVEAYRPEAHDRRPVATSRGPCSFCGIRGELGCAHQRPYEEPVGERPKPNFTRRNHSFASGASRRRVPPPPIEGATGLEREMRLFCHRHGLTPSAFADAIGQTHNWKNGVFVKAREGRLRPATIAKIKAFMAGFEGDVDG